MLGLERIRALLDRIGNPERRLPPVFHVAGTNGKGSVCAFLRAMIEAAGHDCHVYTSPHLVRFNERIRLAGALIEDDMLAAYLGRVLDAADGISPSFFETTTAAALLAFAETPADACVIEVGLGGRLDATNIIAAPAACGIANLGIDHEAFLLAPEPPESAAPAEPTARIAWEKAGIAKPGVPLVTFDYAPGMNAAIEQVAASVGAPLRRAGRDWHFEAFGGGIAYHDAARLMALPAPALPGAHQLGNAALAAAMLAGQAALPVDEAAIARGVLAASWPARLQRLGNGPLTALRPGTPVWLDGGHNQEAGRALATHFAGQRLHLVIGMLANKHPASLLGPLAPMLASVSAVPVPGHEWHGVEAFREVAPDGVAILSQPDARQALAALPDDDLPVLIAGSLYLAGEILRANGEPPG